MRQTGRLRKMNVSTMLGCPKRDVITGSCERVLISEEGGNLSKQWKSGGVLPVYMILIMIGADK